MSQSPRDDEFDPADLDPPSTGGGEQNDRPETDEGSAPQTEEGEDQRPNRRQNLGNRVSYLTRKVSQLERLFSSTAAELETERQRNRAAQSVQQTTQWVGEAEATVAAHLASATARYEAALADGKNAEAATINRDIVALSVRQARLQEHRDTVTRQREPEPQQPGGGAPQQAEHVADWLDTNQDWFNMRPANQTQQILTQRALQIEQELAKKGLELQSPRILAAISQRMHNEFPDYFGVRPQPKPQSERGWVEVEVQEPPRQQIQQAKQTMPAASRYAPATAGGTGAPSGRQVKLTSEEMQFAKSLGMTPAQYASMKD